MAFLTEDEWLNFTHALINVAILRGARPWREHPLEIFCSFIYAILFVCGAVSNLWVFKVVWTVVKRCAVRSINVLVYIGALAAINLLILTSLPIAMMDMIAGEWLLPDFLCPVYWASESLNKTVSSLILSCLTVSCYCAVCQPQMERMYRSGMVSVLHIAVSLLIFAWKVKPFLDYSATFRHIDIDLIEGNITNLGKKCIFQPPDEDDVFYLSVDAFVSTYLLPMAYMIGFYAAILRKIRVQCRSIARGGAAKHFWKVAKSVFLLVGFYAATWTPFWLANMTLPIQQAVDADEQPMPVLRVVAFVVHLLPLINCAFSPLLYTLMNCHVRTLYNTLITASHQRNQFHQSRRRSAGHIVPRPVRFRA